MVPRRAHVLPCLLVITCILCCHFTNASTKPKPSLHHHMSERDLQKLFGVTSQDQVPEYTIAQSFVDEDEETESHSRLKRDLKESSTKKSYTLKTNESAMHLKLKQDNDVKSPNLVVRTYHDDGSTTDSDASHVQLYSGHVTGHPGSKVLVSEQEDGLTGVIHLNEDEFHVRPLPAKLAEARGYKGPGRPHVIHRRSLRGPTSSTPKWTRTRIKHKVLEMTLEADQFAIGLHGNAITEQMLLVAHIARDMFLDDSIGPIKINLVVIGIILKKNGFNYGKSSSVQKRLEVFSKWSDKNLPSNDTHPDHPDTAVLLTTDVIGWAMIPSTCYSYYKMGRAVVGDKGFASATILAHETAHTLGLDHDGERTNTRCPDFKNIMASKTSKGAASFTWSVCSRNEIQKFLSGPKSKCLDDAPQKSPLPNGLSAAIKRRLPGELKSRDEQCEMLMGPGFINCRHTPNGCQLLLCEKKGSTGYYVCPHEKIPPAEGSKCGPRHWCINGKCEDNGTPIINGGWSPWSRTYTRCSRTCGEGIQWKTRKCNNPKPANDGKPCQGEDKGHFKTCNSQDCPPGMTDDRIAQCKAKDPTFQDTHYYDDKCVLGCTKKKNGKNWGWKKGTVQDGTRCSKDAKIKDVCIDGKCRVVGCDGKIDSKVQRDRCGVCNGDSSSCSYVTAQYSDPCNQYHGQICDVLTIPVGSKNVKVEKNSGRNFNCLGIQDKNRNYITSYFPSISQDVYVAGTMVSYFRTRSNKKDKVTIKGPTTEVLYIVMKTVRRLRNRGVTYTLLHPTKRTKVKLTDFRWKVSRWKSCSRTCGKGQQLRTVQCVRKDDRTYVGDRMCKRAGRKPMAVKTCKLRNCRAKWNVSEWTSCSKTCGAGVQTRKIVCRQEISDSVFQVQHGGWCGHRYKPRGAVKRTCNHIACPVEWVPSAWSKCSKRCHGVTTRTLSCEQRSRQGKVVYLHHSMCAHLPYPVTRKSCNKSASCRG